MKISNVLLAGVLLPVFAIAQVAAPNAQGVSMGHLHIYSKDPGAQKRLWVDVVGATPAKLATLDVYKMPGAIIFINSRDTSSGTEGSTVNHLGFLVRDLKGTLAKSESSGVKILSQNETQAMLLGPDDVRVELTADPTLAQSVKIHHIHFYATDVDATRQWYVTTFGAIPGKRGKFDAADLPGVNLSFTKSATPAVGTKGRALDHIGFEVKDLEAITKKMQSAGVKFDIPYRKLPKLGIAIAFFTDPWGTYIELTEGLNQVQ